MIKKTAQKPVKPAFTYNLKTDTVTLDLSNLDQASINAVLVAISSVVTAHFTGQ